MKEKVVSSTPFVDKVIVGECCEVMENMPEQSVDMIFADPPYNLQIGKELLRPDTSKVQGVEEDWDSFETFKAYDAFSKRWLAAARRVLKNNGTLWVMGSYHNIFRVGTVLQDLDFWLLNDIIWVKNNPMPNFLGRRFTNAHETLLWASKSKKSKYHFNYDALKSLNEGLQMRSDWYLPLCTGKERLTGEDGKKLHPTQKPESLLYRVILATSLPGQTILDPFLGTGTTAAVAKKLGRHYIGIEQDATYAKKIEERLEAIQKPQKYAEIEVTPVKRKERLIPFGHLVETGHVRAGSELVSACTKFTAEVQADGSIKTGKNHGSIHQIGAMLQGKPSCNGWQYWHIKMKGNLDTPIPIDALRKKIREQRLQSKAPELLALEQSRDNQQLSDVYVGLYKC